MEIEIDEDLQKILEARAKEKDFDKTERYIEHLLEQVAGKIVEGRGEEKSYSSEQEEKVKDKLEDLGYKG